MRMMRIQEAVWEGETSELSEFTELRLNPKFVIAMEGQDENIVNIQLSPTLGNTNVYVKGTLDEITWEWAKALKENEVIPESLLEDDTELEFEV